MKSVAVVATCLLVAAFAQLQQPPKFPPRELPADVLRDFPGMCFASTACRVFEVNKSWPLTPFCGQATCVQNPQTGELIESVEDCGPLPKPNNDCRIVNENARNLTFPDCCPKFECAQGVQLVYPTPEELQALAQQQAQQQGQQGAQQADRRRQQ
ncbi:unnamed protein product [Meganyctiphanes norvegica]|uniref:Single domain-containing protein n=1 Tax=Meganyctiphanes norvegica TaxID=48144 RepID=A0AAV2QRA7_MEGNR